MLLLFFRIIHVIAVYMAVIVAFASPLSLAEQVFIIACLIMGPGLIYDSILTNRKRKLA